MGRRSTRRSVRHCRGSWPDDFPKPTYAADVEMGKPELPHTRQEWAMYYDAMDDERESDGIGAFDCELSRINEAFVRGHELEEIPKSWHFDKWRRWAEKRYGQLRAERTVVVSFAAWVDSLYRTVSDV